VLQEPFASGPEVTKACLSCHTEASKQLQKTTHWTWEFASPDTGQALGKKVIVNNFCVAVSSNYPRCTSCHIGYGWKDASFDFNAEENVDCLVCHDTTGTYKKLPAGAGHPAYQPTEFPPKSGKLWEPPDLSKVAQQVGPTSRATCGTCHFYGGGGNAIKHGDLDSSMGMPSHDLDVHMDAKGLNFTCTECHTTGGHEVPGSRYHLVAKDSHGFDLPRDDRVRSTCESCHGLRPMHDPKLNDHTDKVACQTCHIPQYARGGLATKMWWDWSKAGEMKDGKPMQRKGANGEVVYDTMKGEFRWAKDVVPEYIWFNGKVGYTLLNDKIDDRGIVPINTFYGSPDDPGSRIWPVKRFRGVQPYDVANKTLVVPHLFGKDDAAYWKSYDWGKAIKVGMQSVGADYSGQLGFVESEMLWPITHMVAPAAQALGCADCHATDGRLAGLPGVYMPGRDHHRLLDLVGWLLIAGAVGGTGIHGALRFLFRRKRA
jgi:octaheme c-type cytochrome (tetrathionate reductase family)